MSIAWSVGDHEEELKQELTKLNSELQSMLTSVALDYFSTYVSYLQCKSGNKVFNFPLS